MIKVWVHLVWATKCRQPLLEKCIRQNIFQHMLVNARGKKIHVDFINGHFDHVHVLLSLNADQTIAKIVQLIKGESSHWINTNNLTRKYFEWQSHYFAVSVSESGVARVREYIRNQEQRHLKKTFEEECDEFIKRYGFVLEKDALG
jgi:REP element-mobilizing transposase RayT